MTPKVSVVMSVYNGELFLKEAIESILAQTFSNIEFIIVNDGSTDGSAQIISHYSSRDNRIKVIQNQVNLGLTPSLNKGLNLAGGDYIARQDADDISHLTRLEKQVDVLDSNPHVVLVSSSFETINSSGTPQKTTGLARSSHLLAWYNLLLNYVGPHSVTMFRRGAALAVGGYDNSFRYAQDYDLWSRLLWQGDFVVLPDVLLQWRGHAENISARYLTQQSEFATTIAGRNLQQLTGQKFSHSELNQLKKLWEGSPLDKGNLSNLHNNLKLIYRAFLQWRQAQNQPADDLPAELRRLISQRLLYCARASSFFASLLFKMRVLPYAIAWHPLGVLEYWLKIPSKLVKQIIAAAPHHTAASLVVK